MDNLYDVTATMGRPIPCLVRFLWLYDDGWKQTFPDSLRVGLDGIEGDILIFLGMALPVTPVEKCAVGLKDMVDPVLECGDKACSTAFEKHPADGYAFVDSGEFLNRYTVGFQVVLILNHSPDQMFGRDSQRFSGINNCMGHDNGVVADSEPVVGPTTQEAIEADKHMFTEMGLADLGPVGRDVEPFEPGIDDETVLLGVGAFPQPCILEEGSLRDQDVFPNMGLAFGYCIAVQ